MKRKRHLQLSIPKTTQFDNPPAVLLLPIEDIQTNVNQIFATLFNTLPDGIHTFASVSPSLSEISFSSNRSGSDVHWGEDYEEFIDSLVCRLALTGQAILTVTSFLDKESHMLNGISNPLLVIQGWHLAGDAHNPASFDIPAIRKWYGKYGMKRPTCRIEFVKGTPL